MKKYGQLLQDVVIFMALAEKSTNSSKTYGPYKRKSDGRWVILVQDNDDGKFKTKSYPKYLMEQSLGKDLGDLTVDHWDSNVDNNSLDNLRVIERAEHSRQDTRRVEPVKLKCSMCQKEFERLPRLLRDKHKKGAKGVFCSRQCSGKYNRLSQLGRVDILPVQDYVESKYYKAKYRKADFIEYIFDKYAIKKPSAEQYNIRMRDKTLSLVKDYDWYAGSGIGSRNLAPNYCWFSIKSFNPYYAQGDYSHHYIDMVEVRIHPDLSMDIIPDKEFPPEGIEAIKRAKEEVYHSYFPSLLDNQIDQNLNE